MRNHSTTVEICPALPAELDVGAVLTLRIRAACAAGCDLRGAPITIVLGEDMPLAAALTTRNGTTSESEALYLKAPEQPGDHVLTVVLPRNDAEGHSHGESSATAGFKTIPHATSMAAWDIPSPVVVNHEFVVTIGVKCSVMCCLAGQLIEVCDEAGMRMGQAILDRTPWPGTAALYVAAVHVVAPARVGTFSWSCRFANPGSAVAHAEAAMTFGFVTAPPPDHRVVVKITDKHTGTPIEQVDVRCGCYHSITGSNGLAMLEVPAGTYEVSAWVMGYDDASARTLVVASDLATHVEMELRPIRDIDEGRVWM